jgi:hypothetical protein
LLRCLQTGRADHGERLAPFCEGGPKRHATGALEFRSPGRHPARRCSWGQRRDGSRLRVVTRPLWRKRHIRSASHSDRDHPRPSVDRGSRRVARVHPRQFFRHRRPFPARGTRGHQGGQAARRSPESGDNGASDSRADRCRVRQTEAAQVARAVPRKGTPANLPASVSSANRPRAYRC